MLGRPGRHPAVGRLGVLSHVNRLVESDIDRALRLYRRGIVSAAGSLGGRAGKMVGLSVHGPILTVTQITMG